MKEKILKTVNKKPLTGMTILNTRPLQQAAELDARINLLGGKTIHFPTIEIVPPQDTSILQTALKKLETFDIAIFVSAHAVESCFNQQKNWPPSLPILSVGPGTAKALEKFGQKPCCLPTEFNSEGLLELAILKKVTHKNIAIFCGENTRPVLSDVLKQRDANVEQIICYRRQKPQINYAAMIIQLKKTKIDCIVATSPEILNNLYDIFQAYDLDWLRNIPILVISEKMSNMVKEYEWCCPALVAENATTEAIIQRLSKT